MYQPVVDTLNKSMLYHVHFVFSGQDSTRYEEKIRCCTNNHNFVLESSNCLILFLIIGKPSLFSKKGTKYSAIAVYREPNHFNKKAKILQKPLTCVKH